MTSIPASRRARATTFAPRSCPSRPGLAMTTRTRDAGPLEAGACFGAALPFLAPAAFAFLGLNVRQTCLAQDNRLWLPARRIASAKASVARDRAVCEIPK